MIRNDDDDEINKLAYSMDLPYPVQVSRDLSEQIKPNEFLTGLGIHYLDRIKTILGILKGNMILNKELPGEILPKQNQVIYFTHAKGPYIKEEVTSIRVEMKDDGGEKVILLTAIPKEE
jgi:hypothetical protein